MDFVDYSYVFMINVWEVDIISKNLMKKRDYSTNISINLLKYE